MEKEQKRKTYEEQLLEQARKSGLAYGETIAWMARTTGGHGTHIYSDTDVDAVKRANARAENNVSK